VECCLLAENSCLLLAENVERGRAVRRGQQGVCPLAFSLFNTSARSRPHSSVGLLDRSAGSKTDPIEMTVICDQEQ
jgi:hypothetical protein